MPYFLLTIFGEHFTNMVRTILASSFIFFGIITILACSEARGNYETVPAHNADTLKEDTIRIVELPILIHDTTLSINFHVNPIEVIIKFPTEVDFKGTRVHRCFCESV